MSVKPPLSRRIEKFILIASCRAPLWVRFRRVTYGVELRPWYRFLMGGGFSQTSLVRVIGFLRVKCLKFLR
jgi:hypothetical protein